MIAIAKKQRFIILLLLAVVVIHGALFIHVQRNFPDVGKSFDTQYTNISENLYRYGVYSTGARDATGNLLPTLSEPPLFVVLYYLNYKIFGVTPAADMAMRVLQMLANIGVMIVCWRIGLFFSERAGKAAASFAALDLTAFYFAQNYQIPDTLLGFFMALWLLYFVKFLIVEPSNKNILLSTLFLGLAMWTKIAVYMLWVPLAFFLAGFLWQNRSVEFYKKARLFGVFAAVILIFFGGWKLRNFAATEYSAFSSGATSLRWNASHLIAYQQGISRTDALRILENRYISAEVLRMDEGAREKYLAGKMARLILESPLDFSMVVLKALPGMLLGTFPPYMVLSKQTLQEVQERVVEAYGNRKLLMDFLREGRFGYVLIYGITKLELLIMYAAGLAAAILFLRDKALRWVVLAMALTVVYTMAVSGAAAQARYRTIIFPICYVLGGYGIAHLWKMRRKYQL